MNNLPARYQCVFAGLLVACTLAAALVTLAERPLFNPDEGRYAEIPREMLQQGDWVVPHLNGVAYIEKPPLQYWLTAMSFAALGESEFSARLFTFCASLGTLVAVGWAARAIGSRESTIRSVFVLGGMSLFVLMGQLLTLDMGLSFFLTCSLAGFVVAQTHAEHGFPIPARRAMLVAWMAAALGMLTKGLIAVVIPAMTLLLYSLYRRDFSPWRRLHLVIGMPLFFTIVVPWHWLAQRRLADFLQFFFVREHFERFATPISDRREQWWFFGAVLMVGALPWTVSAVRVLASGWRRRPGVRGFDANLFLWIWAIFTFGFFSLSDSKLVPYVLPAFPALAMLIGRLPTRELKIDLKLTAIILLITAVAFAGVGAQLAVILGHSERAQYFLHLRSGLAASALVLLVAASAVLYFGRAGVTGVADTQAGVIASSLGWCLMLLVMVYASIALAPIYSGITLVGTLAKQAPDAPIYSVDTYDQTLPFYLRRTVTLVKYRGELDYGLRHDPARGIADTDQFLVRWRNQPDALAIMETDIYDSFKAHNVSMKELGRDARRIVVGHP